MADQNYMDDIPTATSCLWRLIDTALDALMDIHRQPGGENEEPLERVASLLRVAADLAQKIRNAAEDLDGVSIAA